MNKKKLKEFVYRNWLKIAVIFFIIIGVTLMILYLSTFTGGLSDNHSRWGDFGSFFGSLTGLLAFIGVIMSLTQSKQQVLTSEERETFFNMLDIFREHRNKVCIEQVRFVDQPFDGKTRIVDKNEYVNGEIAFKQLANESNYFFLQKILKYAPHNMTEEEMISFICPENCPKNDHFTKMSDAIKTLYIRHNLYFDDFNPYSIADFKTSSNLAYNIIKYYIHNSKYYLLSYAMMIAGDNMYSIYRNQLGPYYRNIFYVYDIITKFEQTNKYSKLFRAQLSKDELTVIFFNAFSIESNPTAREYYLEGSLFNNLAWNDVWITQKSFYIDKNLLGCLYKAADKWYWEDQKLKKQKMKESK